MLASESVALADWGSLAVSAAVLAFVAYDIWWVRRPRLRVRMRRYRDSERLDMIVINRGGSPLTILNVYFEESPVPGVGLKMEWKPEDGSLPTTLSGGSAADWHVELANPMTMVLAGVPFGERFFAVPPAGWEGRNRRLRRGEVFRGITRELKGQRKPPTPEKPLRLR